MQPRWKDPMETPEGELLLIVKELEKNIGCVQTGDYKSDRGQKAPPDLPKPKKQKHNKPKKGEDDVEKATCPCTEDGGTCNCSSECSECKCNAIDKTTEFLASKGIVVKYEQEPDVSNSVPTFMDHSGGIPVEAIGGYHTNQTLPDYQEKAPKDTFISEKAKIPSVSQTGYDEKGSSLYMHLTDGGGITDNRATIEESMTELKKAGGYGNPGLVEEIAGQLEQLMGRLS